MKVEQSASGSEDLEIQDPGGIQLQPLRVTHGWAVDWNALYEIDPTRENVEAFLFTSSTLFCATNVKQRLLIDVAWLPPDEPEGRFVVEVYRAPQVADRKDHEAGNSPFNFHRDGELTSTFETRSRPELVAYLEETMLRAWEQ